MDLLILIGIALFFAILIFMRDKSKTVYQKNNVTSVSEVLRSVTKLIINPYLIAYSLIAVGLYTPLSAMADIWGISFIRQKFGINPIIAGSISDLLFLGLAAGSLIIPWSCEKKKIINKDKTTPISDVQTLLVHFDGHNALENGLIGQK